MTEQPLASSARKAIIGLVAGWMGVGLAHAGMPMTLEATDEGGVTARAADGSILWRVEGLANGQRRVEIDADGRIVLGGEFVLNRQGAVVSRLAGGDSVPYPPEIAEGMPGWDVPIVIGDDSESASIATIPPFVDSSGDAWAILPGFLDGDFVIKATRSRGSSNVWAVPDIVFTSPNFVAAARAVMDSNDRITVAFRELADGMNHVKVLRYYPGVGWEAARTVFSTPEFFQRLDAAVDDEGNVVVSIDLADTGRMIAFVYEAATDSWSQGTDVVPASAGSLRVPTLIQNRAGTHVYAVYQLRTAPGRGMYVRRFLSPALGWAAPRRAPGTYFADLPGGSGPLSSIPAVVDDAGSVTVPFYIEIEISGSEDIWIFRTVRLEAGARWQRPVSVMAHREREPLLVEFADADYSIAGDVAIGFKRGNSNPLRTNMVVLRYDAADGIWDAPATVYLDDSGTTGRTRIVFRNDNSLLAIFGDLNTGLMGSRLFDGVWLPDLINIPGSQGTPLLEATADGLDVTLIYDVFSVVSGTRFREDSAQPAMQ